MNSVEKYEQSKLNIRQALEDYRRYDERDESEVDNVTEDFIETVAHINMESKKELRELFRKSPCWNEKLDALIINGTHTHDPNPERLYNLTCRLLRDAIKVADPDMKETIRTVINFFYKLDTESAWYKRGLEALNKISPKAYKVGRKKSRVFRQLCVDLGIWDETAGSEFQALYARLADEFAARKIPYKLFVSVNPAHFITMSNPKYDKRGCTLTSCHSFNSEEYEYNNGCSGYACDEYSFIVFTVDDPSNPELLNNRKTTRQIFAYKPYGGVLLQSRMYNTGGGTRGAQEESKEYRDLIQREIASLEGKVNLWKTQTYCGNTFGVNKTELEFYSGAGFGGYCDWQYSNFDAKISVMLGHTPDNFYIGTYGRCIVCGEATSEGLYCEKCGEDARRRCADCGGYCDELYTVYDDDGDPREVCYGCRHENYTLCDRCQDYFPAGSMVNLRNGDLICDSCCDEYYTRCAICGEFEEDELITNALTHRNFIEPVCEDCIREDFFECDDCGECIHDDFRHEDENGYAYCNTCFVKHDPRTNNMED